MSKLISDEVISWSEKFIYDQGEKIKVLSAHSNKKRKYNIVGWTARNSENEQTASKCLEQKIEIPYIKDFNEKATKNVKSDFELDIKDFSEGFYKLVFIIEIIEGEQKFIDVEGAFFCVGITPSTITKRHIGVITPTFTLQAYNPLGDFNFYRPHPKDLRGTRTIKHNRPLSTSFFDNREHHTFIPSIKTENVLKDLGYKVYPMDNLTAHENKDNILNKFQQLITIGHDEYLTFHQRKNLLDFVAQGGNLTIFSGNFCWWKVEYIKGEISVTKGKKDEENKLFRKKGLWKGIIPEKKMSEFGLNFDNGGYPLWGNVQSAQKLGLDEKEITKSAGMRVLDPSHPIYNNLNMKRKMLFGVEEQIVDVEVDGYFLDNEEPQDKKINKLASSKLLKKIGGEKVIETATISEVLSDNPEEGRIMHMGSIGWFKALSKDGNAKEIFKNTVKYQMKSKEDENKDNVLIVCGASRSGTTLTTTIFDAHPDVSMCYEIVPKKFNLKTEEYIKILQDIKNDFKPAEYALSSDERDYAQVQNQLNKIDNFFGNWVRLCRRSGVTIDNLLEILNSHLEEGFRKIDSEEERFALAQKVVKHKNDGKLSTIGFKAGLESGLYDFFKNPKVLFIVRDPRDAYASWKRLKWRDKTAKEHAEQWLNLYNRTVSMVSEEDLIIIEYPKWISGDQEYPNSIFKKAGLSDYDINQYHKDTSVKEISNVRITKEDLWSSPLTKDRVGYYKDILTKQEIKDIEDVTMDIIEKHKLDRFE